MASAPYSPMPDPLVTLKLSEIQRIRDQLRRLSDSSPLVRVLWSQVHGLYERLEKASKQTEPTKEGAR